MFASALEHFSPSPTPSTQKETEFTYNANNIAGRATCTYKHVG